MTESAAPFEDIIVSSDDRGLTRITINRPDARNAMSLHAQAELCRALDECRDTAKVVVITGNGPSFCSGIDLKERRERVAQGIREPLFAATGNSWVTTNLAIREHPAVFVAAVNGFALGGGLTLVNSCDLAIAADEARLGMPEITFASFPAYAGPSTQQRAAPKVTAWMALTGEKIDGRRAVEWGLVNKAVPLVDLAAEVDALVDHLLQFEAHALAACKRALYEIPERSTTYQGALELGAAVLSDLRLTQGK